LGGFMIEAEKAAAEEKEKEAFNQAGNSKP
jgi:hypothetical protein